MCKMSIAYVDYYYILFIDVMLPNSYQKIFLGNAVMVSTFDFLLLINAVKFGVDSFVIVHKCKPYFRIEAILVYNCARV